MSTTNRNGYFIIELRAGFAPRGFQYASHEVRRSAAIDMKADPSVTVLEADVSYGGPASGVGLSVGNPAYIPRKGEDT